MMVSISPRWPSEKFSADAAGVTHSASANRAGMTRRKGGIGESSWVSFSGQVVVKTGFSKNLVGRVGLFVVAYFQLLTSVALVQLPLGGGFAVIMSSALTHPGVPIAKRVFAREARSRAVLLSPRRYAACAEARSASARSPFRA